jgi:hypothetical protein
MEIIASDDGLTMTTLGLRSSGGLEICATADDIDLMEECRRFLLFAAAYIEDGNQIMAGETLGYGYWITKAMADDKCGLCFWEYTSDAKEYVPGISNTLRYWRDQHQICEAASSLFSPPNAQQLVTISDGVFEGDDVQGVRYPSPTHMSGWWITTDRYDGNASSLKTVHAYHLTAQRPDLARFLALAYGYRFYSDNGEVRFDQKIITGANNGGQATV